MGQQEPAGAFDLGVLRTPRGLLLGAQLALCGAVVGLLAPPAPPTLAPALLQTLAGAAALGGRLLRHPPRLPHGYTPCLDLLRAVSGTIIFFVTALVALAASRDALAATTFTFSLILSFLFAFDAFVTYRTEVAPAVGREPDMDST
ncbi:CKLF-like MARVEL transmembrane domain-containing protein 5 [Haliaeetus albicilla]|uniref:CKLF-like MARVEL transmembrane domain-containing protein 5 n=1 Tax=Haliaeetus albicilla TaxID=8969 RepID=UPI0037E76DC0